MKNYIEKFNSTIEVWITELEYYDFDVLLVKQDCQSWSLSQVFIHLCNETEYYIEQIEICLSHDENSSEEMNETGKMMFAKNEFPDEKIKGDPVVSENLPQPKSKLQLQEKIRAVKLQMNSIWKKTNSSKHIGKTKHPGHGYFNAQDWLRYSEMHLRHHLRQKRSIDDFLKTKPEH
ncbi:MAG: DinB family protein [Bacteroidota bacterium]